MCKIKKESFGVLSGGEPVSLFTLTNDLGAFIQVTDYGATLVSVVVYDKYGALKDVILGYDDPKGYESHDKYIGATIGRCCNRIAKGTFQLDNKTYSLAMNNNGNHLHGGLQGFDKKIWTSSIEKDTLFLSVTSPHMEEGYPGNLTVTVSYSFDNTQTLTINYSAKTDQDTVVSLTNHTYFNLTGNPQNTILKERAQFFADYYTPINETSIPLGSILSVKDTPFDFREPKEIGQDIHSTHEQIQSGCGYDHNFVVNDYDGTLKKAAFVTDEKSGITLLAKGTLPGFQFYTGNFLDGAGIGKKGIELKNRCGFCLEMQHFPNAVNEKNFPSPILKKEEEYKQTIVYQFGLLKE